MADQTIQIELLGEDFGPVRKLDRHALHRRRTAVSQSGKFAMVSAEAGKDQNFSGLKKRPCMDPPVQEGPATNWLEVAPKRDTIVFPLFA